VRLYLVSVLEHARPWLAEDRKQMGDQTDRRGGLLRAA